MGYIYCKCGVNYICLDSCQKCSQHGTATGFVMQINYEMADRGALYTSAWGFCSRVLPFIYRSNFPQHDDSNSCIPGPCPNIKMDFPGLGISVVKIRQSWDSPIFTMGIGIRLSLHWDASLQSDQLTHWGQVTHICVSKLTIIGSDNG